jgi:hypothetical protein
MEGINTKVAQTSVILIDLPANRVFVNGFIAFKLMQS